MASLLSLSRAVRAVGGPRSLLFARVDLSALQGTSSTPLGAPKPSVAKATYTREARRIQRQRQLERRSGTDRFLASLR